MPSTGLRPEPVLPVTPLTNSVGDTSPSFSNGTLASRMAVAKQPGCATCARRRARQVFGQRTGELAQAPRRAVRVLVHLLVGRRGGVAIVRGDVDDPRRVAGLGRDIQQ